MNRMDFSCFTGNWPFHHIRYNTPEKLAQLHSRYGITGGFLSACEAVFYQDPYEAELALAEQLKGTGYRQALVLNPMLPGWQDDLRRAVETLHIQAVRLVPGYHGYCLTDPVMDTAAEALRRYKLPLILNPQLDHMWNGWMIQPRQIPIEEIRAFLERYPDIPTLLSYLLPHLMPPLEDLFQSRENLFMDTAGFRSRPFPTEEAVAATGGKVVLGTLAPLIAVQSYTLVLDKAEIPEEVREDIYTGRRFLAAIARWQQSE